MQRLQEKAALREILGNGMDGNNTRSLQSYYLDLDDGSWGIDNNTTNRGYPYTYFKPTTLAEKFNLYKEVDGKEKSKDVFITEIFENIEKALNKSVYNKNLLENALRNTRESNIEFWNSPILTKQHFNNFKDYLKEIENDGLVMMQEHITEEFYLNQMNYEVSKFNGLSLNDINKAFKELSENLRETDKNEELIENFSEKIKSYKIEIENKEKEILDGYFYKKESNGIINEKPLIFKYEFSDELIKALEKIELNLGYAPSNSLNSKKLLEVLIEQSETLKFEELKRDDLSKDDYKYLLKDDKTLYNHRFDYFIDKVLPKPKNLFLALYEIEKESLIEKDYKKDLNRIIESLDKSKNFIKDEWKLSRIKSALSIFSNLKNDFDKIKEHKIKEEREEIQELFTKTSHKIRDYGVSIAKIISTTGDILDELSKLEI